MAWKGVSYEEQVWIAGVAALACWVSGNAEAADAAADLAVSLTAAAAVACPCNNVRTNVGTP